MLVLLTFGTTRSVAVEFSSFQVGCVSFLVLPEAVLPYKRLPQAVHLPFNLRDTQQTRVGYAFYGTSSASSNKDGNPCRFHVKDS